MARSQMGWYVDWDDHTQMRYFNGTHWTPQTVNRTSAAYDLPPTFDIAKARSMVSTSAETVVSDGLGTAAGFVYMLAGLTAIAAVVGGVELISHKISNCIDYYCTDTHPFTSAGWAVIIGGLVQAVLFAILGRVAQVTSENRAQLRVLLAERAG